MQKKLVCSDVEARVMAYLKGGLTGEYLRAFREHLLTCERCTRLVQEARELDAALYEAARSNRPWLSPEKSVRIQERVYRRMRRALILQRTRNVTERALAALVVVLLVAGAVVVGNPWLAFVAGSQGTETAPTTAVLESADSQATERPRATAIPQWPALPPATPPTVPTAPAETGPLAAVMTADRAAHDLIQAAIDGDQGAYRPFLEWSRPLSRAGARVWERLHRCKGVLTADDLRLTTMVHQGTLASVYVFNENRYIGDVKLRLQADGNWYQTYLNYGSFSPLVSSCGPDNN